MAFPGALNYLPEGIESTLDLVAEFDSCFLVGFANLEAKHQEILKSWQYLFTGTPLEQPMIEACNAILTNEFIEKHFCTLAAARVALQGSLFDSLQSQLDDILERPHSSEISLEFTSINTPSHIQVWQESIRQWLMEIALVGFSRLDQATLLAFIPTLEKIQEEPLLIRQSALLTGYMNELTRQVPIKDSNSLPLYRWVDLWTQGMIGGLGRVANPQATIVSGDFAGLGMDIKTHRNLVNWTIYGLLSSDNNIQLAKISQSAYKVDAISNDEIWLLFPHGTVLLAAFAENKTLKLTDISILPTGDLIWQGDGEIGDKYKLMETAAESFAPKSPISGCYVMPDTRHPIQIGEPVYLNNYQITQTDDGIFLDWGDDGKLKIDCDRLSKFSPITTEDILASSELFGLMRFDNYAWRVQPLAVKVNKKVIYTGQNAAKIIKGKSKTSTVGILQERASRLLRKK